MTSNNVVQINTKKDNLQRASEQKWGKQAMQLGFCIFPSLILRAQHRLGLNPTQLAVLLQLADFWWHAGRNPWPSIATLAERLSLSRRQVQRYITELEQAELISRIERRAHHKGKLSNEYNLSGLVERLAALAPEFAASEQKVREIRSGVRKKGLKKKQEVADE